MAPAAEGPSVPAGNPTYRNPPWAEATVRVLVVRLSPFAVAERSLTHLLLAHEVRRGSARAYVDLLFYPTDRSSSPALGSLHGGRPPRHFDLLLLSNSYLLELMNVPALLRDSGIPSEAHERGDADPVVILGGANALAAHALVEPSVRPPGQAPDAWASAVDAFYFGEGEGQVCRIVETWERHRGEERRGALLALAGAVEALWVPPIAGEPAAADVRKAVLGSVGPEDIPSDYPVLDGAQAATARLQITYGCPAQCSFCFESHDRRPFREVPLDLLLQAARLVRQKTGAQRLELSSFNFTYHSAFPVLIRELSTLFGEVSFMSQRIDVLARNPELLPFEIASGKRSYTLGIEGVSARLRAFLQKGIAQEDLDAVLRDLVRRRVRELKLFYIVTGYEEAADLAELGSFLSRIRSERSSSGAPRIILSFTYLLRMPFTPLRRDPPLLDRRRAAAIVRDLERVAAELGFELRMAGRWEEHVACQLLASGGYGARSLLRALADAGLRYDGSFPPRAWPVVERWMAGNAGLLASLVRGAPPGGADAFAFVKGVPDPERLERSYRVAVEALSARGPETPFRFSPSHGALDVAGMEALLRSKRAAERDAVYAITELGPETAATGVEWRSAWLLRELFRRRPEAVDLVLSAELVTPAADAGWDFAWYGKAVVRIVAWRTEAAAELVSAGAPFVRAATRCEAGAFREMELRIVLDGAEVQRVRGALAEFLSSIHCPVLTTRDGDGYLSRATPLGTKRRSYLAGRLRGVAAGVEVTVTAGERLPVRELVRALTAEEAPRGPLVQIVDLTP